MPISKSKFRRDYLVFLTSGPVQVVTSVDVELRRARNRSAMSRVYAACLTARSSTTCQVRQQQGAGPASHGTGSPTQDLIAGGHGGCTVDGNE